MALFYNLKEGSEKDETRKLEMSDASIYLVKNGTMRKVVKPARERLSSSQRRKIRKNLKEVK